MFRRRGRKSSVIDESQSTITMKNLDKEIYFLTDGYFDFNDGLWRSGGKVIRRVHNFYKLYNTINIVYYILNII